MKPLHWGSELWCGVLLTDCLVCICPAAREALFFARLHVRIGASRFQFHRDLLWAKLSTTILERKGFSFYFVFPLTMFESV